MFRKKFVKKQSLFIDIWKRISLTCVFSDCVIYKYLKTQFSKHWMAQLI